MNSQEPVYERGDDLRAGEESDRRRLLSLQEAAAYLGVSYWTVRDYVQAGLLPRVALPCANRRVKGGVVIRRAGEESARRILVDRRDLDRLIERNKERLE